VNAVILYVLEWLAIAIVVLFTLTQLVWPWIRGTPILPLFRREHRLIDSLDEAKEGVREAKLEREIASTKRTAERLRPTEPGDPKP
jgi:hypothetical protein